MALKYYSDLTKMFYNSENEVDVAEREYNDKLIAEKEKLEVYKLARKEASDIVKQAYNTRDEKYKEFLDASDKAKIALDNFNKEYGGYHTTIKTYNPIFTVSPRKLIDDVFDLFKNF